MRSLNRAQLIGNLGADPEIRSTGTGQRVASFSLATSRQWTDGAGNKQERTEWHRCIAWNAAKGAQLADVIEKYVSKGDRVYVEGSIEYRSWTDKENQTRYVTEIRVRELIMLSSKPESAKPAGARSATKTTVAPAGPAAGLAVDDFGGDEEDDDELPF